MSDCDSIGCQNYARPGHQFCDWHENNDRKVTAQDTPGPQEVALPLSDLRPLWRQARAAWYGMSASSVFRGYVREEIARRTIAAQAQRIVSLQAAYDLRGTHLDAAQGRIETLENAIVMSGSVLRAIREEIEGE